MKVKLGLMFIAAALCVPAMGCSKKNKIMADRLEQELATCRESLEQLKSGELSHEQANELAKVDCGVCEGGAQ